MITRKRTTLWCLSPMNCNSYCRCDSFPCYDATFGLGAQESYQMPTYSDQNLIAFAGQVQESESNLIEPYLLAGSLGFAAALLPDSGFRWSCRRLENFPNCPSVGPAQYCFCSPADLHQSTFAQRSSQDFAKCSSIALMDSPVPCLG